MTHWEKTTLEYLPRIFLALLVLIAFIFIAKFAKKFSLKFFARVATTKRYNLASIISAIISFFLLLSGVFIAIQILGLEKVLTQLLAGAGVLGIISGFAFKDIASNIFAGMLLKSQSPFQKNDWVEIQSTYGFITELGWIMTKIRTVEGQEVFVPNQLIFNNTFTNYSAYHKRRVVFSSGVSYGDDLEHVKTVSLDEVKNVSGVLTDEPIDFYFTNIGSSTYNFELRFWIKFEQNIDYKQAMSDVIMYIKKRLEERRYLYCIYGYNTGFWSKMMSKSLG